MSDPKLNMDELRLKNMSALSHVQLGGLYQHKGTGNHYVIRLVSLREADLEPVVAYAPLREPAVVFTRPLSEWTEKFVKMPPSFR